MLEDISVRHLDIQRLEEISSNLYKSRTGKFRKYTVIRYRMKVKELVKATMNA